MAFQKNGNSQREMWIAREFEGHSQTFGKWQDHLSMEWVHSKVFFERHGRGADRTGVGDIKID